MKLCTHCERHILVAEPRCPFCGARFANAPSALTRCRQVVMIGLTVALGTTACGVVDPADTGASNVDSSGTAAAMTTT
ncbi:MAG: hypothetical protein K0V04_39985, partial [Deltaproteobacteria bacterium]|nr:hypothetical protein [Deltaproteobacteria bacterium]